MKEYKITLNPIQEKALACVAYDPFEWIDNAVKNKCRIAIEEIFMMEVERSTSTGGSLSGTKEDIVLNANIKTARQKFEDGEIELQ